MGPWTDELYILDHRVTSSSTLLLRIPAMLPSASSDTVVPPGTSDYLPGLLSRARASHPDLPLDPIILQSLLICLIAQPRPSASVKAESSHGSRSALHLILRTKEEDVGLVVNIVVLVSRRFSHQVSEVLVIQGRTDSSQPFRGVRHVRNNLARTAERPSFARKRVTSPSCSRTAAPLVRRPP